MPPTHIFRAAFAAALIAILSSVPAAGDADVRLGDSVVPTFQSVSLKLDAGEAGYSGSVRIHLEVRERTDRILLHSEGHKLTSVVLRRGVGKVEVQHAPQGDDLIAIRTSAPLAEGKYLLEIDFESLFGTRAMGLYRMEKDGAGYSFTQFEADEARQAFPCWDEPRFKIPYQMTLTVPEGHLAITNTPVEKEAAADGWRTVTFKETKPLPSYLLAIATGPFETVEIPGLGVPGRIVTVQGQSHLAALATRVTPPILKALESYFESPYPFAKLDFIAVPEFWFGAMENPGAVTYADDLLLLDPAAATVAQRRRQAGVIAHELAHMWFGDLVTMEWWDDLWLSESFADWMGDKVTHQVFPEFAVDVTAAQSTQNILGQDARATTEAIRRPIDSVASVLQGVGLAYAKGSAVLGMFENWLGPEVFRRGVGAYIKANAWGNATASDLWRALDETSGKPVSAAMATFIEQSGFPRIAVELTNGGVVLSQERFRNHGSSSADLTWKIPVTLKYSNGDGVTTRSLLLDKPELTVALGGRPDWVFPNSAARGYYRWTLPEGQLGALATAADSVLSPRERIELLGNVSALLDAGAVSGDVYLAVVTALADDPEPMVVSSVIGELSTVKSVFVSADLEAAFAAYLRRTLGPVMERYGLEKNPGEDEAVSLVRPRLFAWLGREGREEHVRRYARAIALAYLDDPASADPELASAALRLSALDGDRQLFEEYRKRFEGAKTPTERQRFLSALGAFEDPEIRQTALAYALEGPLQASEIFSVGFGMFSSESGRDTIYHWLTDNYDSILERMPRAFASMMPDFAGGCSQERLEHARTFFSQAGRSVPGTHKELEKVSEQVQDCVALRGREGAAVARYLSSSQ